MLTVKHQIDSGNERIYSGTHVEWHGCDSDDCPQETGLMVFDGERHIKSLWYSGRAYVMNDSGQTVGVYHLPEPPNPITEPQ